VLILPQLSRKPIVGLILLHAGVAIYLICTLNIWTDEAYSLSTTRQGLGYALYQAIHFENQPPLYFLLLSLWRSLNPSILWARVLSLLFTTLTLAIAPALCKRYAPRVNALVVTGLLAINPFLIWCATNIRAYSLAVLLTALLNLFFYDAFLNPRAKNIQGSPQSLLLYTVAATLALYTHYFLVCLLIAQGLFILLQRHGGTIRRYGIAVIGYSLGFIPALSFFFLHLRSQGTGLETASASLQESIRVTISLLLYYSVPLYGEWGHRSLPQMIQYIFLVCLAGSYLFFRVRKSIPKHEIIFQLQLILLVVFAGMVYGTGTAPLAFRYGYSLFIVSQLSIALLVTQIAAHFNFKRVILISSFALIAVFCVYSNHNLNGALAREGDWIRVSQYIQSHELKNQPIFLYSGSQIHPFSAYYKGINRVFPIPALSSKLDKFDMARAKIDSLDQLRDNIDLSKHQAKEIWLIKAPGYILNRNSQNQCVFGNININCEIVDEFIRQDFNLRKQVRFYESEVLLLRKK
jgi:uncharacterized membrane protein